MLRKQCQLYQYVLWRRFVCFSEMPLCVPLVLQGLVVFPLFFCWIMTYRRTKKTHMTLFWTTLFRRLFFEEEWRREDGRRREVWIFENSTFLRRRRRQNQNRFVITTHTTLVRGRLLRGLNRKTVRRSVVSSSFERSSSSRLWWRRVGVGVVLYEVFCLRLSIEEEKTHPS